MQCHIYYAKDGENYFLITPHEIEPNDLPVSMRDKLNDLEYLGVQEIISGKPILGIDPSEIKNQINKRGFYVKEINKPYSYTSAATAASIIGSGLLLGGLLGPFGSFAGTLLGFWVANKATEDKNEPKP